MQVQVIIVAGGSGKRMGSETPKQFLLLKNKPILMHTMERFHNALSEASITLVLPKDQFNYWKELVVKFDFNIDYKLVEGGSERFYSVKNALDSLPESFKGVVAVHDGVRPMVSSKTILNCINTAQQLSNAIPVVPLTDSIRKIENNNSSHQNRANYRLVQTPQCFNFQLIKAAYNQPFNHNFTDDASVIELLNEKINLVEGNTENIKITTATDLIIAECLLNNLKD